MSQKAKETTGKEELNKSEKHNKRALSLSAFQPKQTIQSIRGISNEEEATTVPAKRTKEMKEKDQAY